jgi:hypothetical protein
MLQKLEPVHYGSDSMQHEKKESGEQRLNTHADLADITGCCAVPELYGLGNALALVGEESALRKNREPLLG